MENTYSFIYQSVNIGDLKVSHAARDEKAKADLFVIEDENDNQLTSIYISHSIKTANAMKMIDSVCESLDYAG